MKIGTVLRNKTVSLTSPYRHGIVIGRMIRNKQSCYRVLYIVEGEPKCEACFIPSVGDDGLIQPVGHIDVVKILSEKLDKFIGK